MKRLSVGSVVSDAGYLMDRKVLAISLVIALVPLSGCIGEFVPGEGYKPTGNTVHIRMWVADMTDVEPFDGFKANLWAFCAAPADPNDEYSRAAIEYREPSGRVVVPDNSDPTGFRYDPEQTQQCSVPGPQLRVQQGDMVIVDFINEHFHPHTIHWHGQYVPWNSDGVPGSTQDSVLPGTSFRYEFEAKRAGTMWYHCHVDTQFHVMMGLYGVIIVEPQDESLEYDVDRDETLVFSNLIRSLVEPDPNQVDPHAKHRHGAVCGVSGIPGCQNPPLTEDPDVFLINGVSAPNTFKRNDTLLKINPGETMRIRMLNAGPFTTETIHLHGHDMLVTHIDGNPIPKAARYYVDTVLIGPGQRYDVMVEGREGNEGIWVMHTHITSRVTNSHQYPGGMLTKLVYEDWLEAQGGAITPYDGVEIPGGIPYIPPYQIPDDVLLPTTQGSISQTGPGADATAEVFSYTAPPVEMPCALQQFWFKATFSNVDETVAPGSLTAKLTDWEGNTIHEAAVTNGMFEFFVEDYYTTDRQGNKVDGDLYQVRDMPMTPGNITFSVTGTSNNNVDVEMNGLINYYPTKEHVQYYATNYGIRDTCEEVSQPGYQQYPPQNAPPLD